MLGTANGAGGVTNAVYDWSCVGHVSWPASDGKPVTASAVVLDYQTLEPVVGATAIACAKGDAECATPDDQGTTDANGSITLTAPGGDVGFEGYVRVSASGHVTSSFFFPKPITTSPAKPGTFYLVAEDTLAQLAGLVGDTLDPTRGHFAVTTLDCGDQHAAGLTIAADDADAKSGTYYVDGKLPSKTATRTDASGAIALLNLPVGPVTLTSTLDVTKETIGTFAAFVRAGEVSQITLPPTP